MKDYCEKKERNYYLSSEYLSERARWNSLYGALQSHWYALAGVDAEGYRNSHIVMFNGGGPRLRSQKEAEDAAACESYWRCAALFSWEFTGWKDLVDEVCFQAWAEGLSFSEISKRTGVPAATAKRRVARLRPIFEAWMYAN